MPFREKFVPVDGTIQTPFGPKKVTLNQSGHFLGRHRGVLIEESSISRFLNQVEEAEKVANEKAEIARRRKALSEDPVEACYLIKEHVVWVGRKTSAYGRVLEEGTERTIEAHIERVHVRGTDQRSKDALVTRADGAKETLPYSSLLRPLSEEDERDILASLRVLSRDEEALAAAREKAKRPDAVVEEALKGTEDVYESSYSIGVRLTISYDFATDTFSTTIAGQSYSDPSKEGLVSQIRAVIVKGQGYRYFTSPRNGPDGGLDEIADRLDYFSTVYRTEQDREDLLKAQAAYNEALAAHKETLAEYAFDRSQMDGIESDA